MTAVLVDVERPVRDWLRGVSLTDLGARVYVGLPTEVTYPALDVLLLDGGIQPGEAPLAEALFTFSVWGDRATPRTTVSGVAWALASLLQATNYAVLDSTLVLMGARIVLGPVPRFDPDGTPRYLLDAALTVKVRS